MAVLRSFATTCPLSTTSFTAPAVALPFKSPSLNAVPRRCRSVTITCTSSATNNSRLGDVSTQIDEGGSTFSANSARGVFNLGPLFPTEFSCNSMTRSDFDTTTADSAVDRARPDWIFVRGVVESSVSPSEENENPNKSVNGMLCSTSTKPKECSSSATDNGSGFEKSVHHGSQNLRILSPGILQKILRSCAVVLLN